jgi:hypothetical protein
MICQQQNADVLAVIANDLPQLRPKNASGLISGDNVIHSPCAVERRAVKRANISLFDQLGQLRPLRRFVSDKFQIATRWR